MSLLLALTGSSAGAYTLTADSGSYSLSGQSAGLFKSRLLVSAVGSYALTGVAAGIYKNHKLSAAAGSYSYSGVSASVVRSRLIVGNTGAYALAGNAALFSKAYRLQADAGDYAINGSAANISYTPIASTSSFNGGFVMRDRKVYVKRGKQYLIFNNNKEADAYLEAEEAIETAKKSSRGAAKRVIKALKVVKPTIAPEPKLEELSALLAKFEVKRDIQTLQKNNDIEALYQIQSMLYALQQDEEDIEFLLLAI